MPRRPGAVHGGHRLALAIAVVLRPVEAAVTQVYAAGEGDVEIPTAGVTEHDELLMVGPSRAHPHVAQALAAGRPDLLAEMPVLLLAERETVQV